MYRATYQQQAYRKVNVETANPGQVLLTLYDAAIRFIRVAIKQIEDNDPAAKGNSLGKAYAIIAEFIHALDHEKSPDLCNNLEQIYGFMLEQIAKANTEMSAEPLHPILQHLSELRETWAQAVTQMAIETAAAANK